MTIRWSAWRQRPHFRVSPKGKVFKAGRGTAQVYLRRALKEMRGGLSKTVAHTPAFRQYFRGTRGAPWGYYGTRGIVLGKRGLDRFIEGYLRIKRRWTPNQVALWMNSSAGRHFVDAIVRERKVGRAVRVVPAPKIRVAKLLRDFTATPAERAVSKSNVYEQQLNMLSKYLRRQRGQ